MVLILNRLRRRGQSLKSHPTDWEKPGIEPATPGLQGICLSPTPRRLSVHQTPSFTHPRRVYKLYIAWLFKCTRVIFYVRRIGLYFYKYRIYGTISIYILKGLVSVNQLIFLHRLRLVQSRYIALKRHGNGHWSKSMSF